MGIGIISEDKFEKTTYNIKLFDRQQQIVVVKDTISLPINNELADLKNYIKSNKSSLGINQDSELRFVYPEDVDDPSLLITVVICTKEENTYDHTHYLYVSRVNEETKRCCCSVM